VTRGVRRGISNMRLRPFMLAAVFAGACGSATDPKSRLRLEVDVQPGVVSAGAPVTVTVTVINVSDRSVSVPLGGSCSRHYEVRTTDGKLVPQWMACRSEGNGPLSGTVLAPGAEWRATYQWDGVGSDPPNLLPAGQYRIHASLFAGCPTCMQQRSAGVPVVIQE
jgi:hypothetical protein